MMKGKPFILAFLIMVSMITASAFADDTEIVGNKTSVVANDAVITNHYVIKVLKKGEEKGKYVRIASVKLDYMPVLVAISTTSLKNKDFVNVLKNNGNVRIGKKIMELSPKVSYNKNSTIKVSNINNPVIKEYLTSVGYSNAKSLVARSITFTKGKETMDITEYIIPNDLD